MSNPWGGGTSPVIKPSRWKKHLWTAAGVAVFLTLALLTYFYEETATTARTVLSLTPENMAQLQLPPGNSALDVQNDPGNAGEAYLSALQSFASDRPTAEQFAADASGDPPQSIALVLSASHRPCSSIFLNRPSDIINYDSNHAALDDLVALGNDMDRAGLRMFQHKHPDDARKYFHAVYALGLGMYRERLVYDEYFKGMGLMNESAQGLVDCEPANSPAAIVLGEEAKDRLDFDAAHVTPIYTVLSSANANVIAANAGDVLAFATEGQDRMLRVEAILKLGRNRFDVATSADQMADGKAVTRLQSDSDPVIQAAANAAANLTVEQYRMIH